MTPPLTLTKHAKSIIKYCQEVIKDDVSSKKRKLEAMSHILDMKRLIKNEKKS